MPTNNSVTLADIEPAVAMSDIDNVGGLASIIYGYHEDVAVWPTLPAPQSEAAVTLEAAGTYTGDLTMKTGCRAYKLDFTDDSAELSITDQGENGGESCLYEVTLHKAKTNAILFGFENATRGRRLFLIATDRNGNSYLLGDKLVAARRVAGDATTTGRAAADLNKVPMKFSYTGPRKLMYTGDLDALLQVAGASEP